MTSRRIPEECRACRHLHTGGIKNDKFDRWCCHYGRPTYEAIGRCRLETSKERK